MTIVKRIACLANSRKLGGRCVAGKEVKGTGYGDWIRPISSSPSGELDDQEIKFENGELPEPLDIIDIRLRRPAPHEYQCENYLIDGTWHWELKGKLDIRNLPLLCDDVEMLWINGHHTGNGLNDRVPIELAYQSVASSLLLIRPSRLSLIVARDHNSRSRKVRADFTFCNEDYRLVVTDPRVERTFLGKEEGAHLIRGGNVYLCVSLGEPYNDFAYKLVAAIIR